MKSGFVLAEVLKIVDRIEFRSAQDYHAMSVVYETLLAQMGSDAGWSGEHYTPRPVVEFIVEIVDPRVGETVYDPCSGSCGFLVSSNDQMAHSVSTVSEHRQLQE